MQNQYLAIITPSSFSLGNNFVQETFLFVNFFYNKLVPSFYSKKNIGIV